MWVSKLYPEQWAYMFVKNFQPLPLLRTIVTCNNSSTKPRLLGSARHLPQMHFIAEVTIGWVVLIDKVSHLSQCIDWRNSNALRNYKTRQNFKRDRLSAILLARCWKVQQSRGPWRGRSQTSSSWWSRRRDQQPEALTARRICSSTASHITGCSCLIGKPQSFFKLLIGKGPYKQTGLAQIGPIHPPPSFSHHQAITRPLINQQF